MNMQSNQEDHSGAPYSSRGSSYQTSDTESQRQCSPRSPSPSRRSVAQPSHSGNGRRGGNGDITTIVFMDKEAHRGSRQVISGQDEPEDTRVTGRRHRSEPQTRYHGSEEARSAHSTHAPTSDRDEAAYPLSLTQEQERSTFSQNGPRSYDGGYQSQRQPLAPYDHPLACSHQPSPSALTHHPHSSTHVPQYGFQPGRPTYPGSGPSNDATAPSINQLAATIEACVQIGREQGKKISDEERNSIYRDGYAWGKYEGQMKLLSSSHQANAHPFTPLPSVVQSSASSGYRPPPSGSHVRHANPIPYPHYDSHAPSAPPSQF